MMDTSYETGTLVRPTAEKTGAMPWAAPIEQPRSHAESPQHSLPSSVLLHLFPGVVLFAFVLWTAALGIEPVLGLLAGIVLVVTPLELGVLLIAGKRASGRWSIAAVVERGEPMPARRVAKLAVPLVAWFVLWLFISMTFLDGPIAQSLFGWYPESIRQFGAATGEVNAPAWVLLAFFGASLLINGVIGPVVEELYFRGYLLPRISRFGRGAAVLNAVLFSLYHLWTPWQNLGRIIGLLPWILTIQKTRSLRLSIAVHVSVNTIFLLMMFALLANGG